MVKSQSPLTRGIAGVGIANMILSATLSKPTSAVKETLEYDFIRIKIKLITASTADEPTYFAEMFTKTQVFHKKMTVAEIDDFLAAHAGKTFHSCVEQTENEEITLLANKKGKVTRLVKPIRTQQNQTALQIGSIPAPPAQSARINSLNRTKSYIIPEGTPVPFLVHLGVMTAQGKVVAAKYDKFRQINRFLEYVSDVLPDILAAHSEDTAPLRVVDFGSGNRLRNNRTGLKERRDCILFKTGIAVKT